MTDALMILAAAIAGAVALLAGLFVGRRTATQGDSSPEKDPDPTEITEAPEPSYDDDYDDTSAPADSSADDVWLDWDRRGRRDAEDD